MELPRSFARVAIAATLFAGAAFPAVVSAHERGYDCDQHHGMDADQRTRFARQHLEREAGMLEIKASQQGAWDAYAAAKLDLMAGFDKLKPLPEDADAAAIAQQRAERAEAAAQSLAKLADATAKLQAVLTDDQRKVLNRLVRNHWHGDDMHHEMGRAGRHHAGPANGPGMSKSPPAAAAKPAN